jgi:hypothetical protein
MKPTFPQEAAGAPVLHEQAVVGLSDDGDALVAQLLAADGEAPQLSLLLFDRAGAPTRKELTASPEIARGVYADLLAAGATPLPLLSVSVSARWPQALAHAADLGFTPRAPALPEPGRPRFRIAGARENGSLPLALRLGDSDGAVALWLSEEMAGESAEEVELARMPLAGAEVEPRLFLQGSVAWLLTGSVLPGPPPHRSIGVRRASLSRGESQLHNLHGLSDYASGDLDAARREFARALACDGSYVDALYNAASAAALADQAEQAVALLRRAAAADPARVQVLGRDDDDLKVLRKRQDVRALLGLKRPPREDVPPPP